MTNPHPLAALIAGVPRRYDIDPVFNYLREDLVLAALEAATPPDLVAVLADADQMIDFLSGQDNIGGMAFGDPNEKGHRFWWRKHLSRFEALIALATAQAAQIAGLGARLEFSRQDSAAGWDGCQERRITQEAAEAEAATLRAEVERLRGALDRIDQWADAYPLEVFAEPDFAKADEVLKTAGLSLSAISASNMRHVIEGVKAITSTELEGKHE